MDFNCEEIFAPYAKRLDALAARINVKVEKYRYDMPVWIFHFSHPNGGHGYVQMNINQKNEIHLGKNWLVDDYLSLRRAFKYVALKRIENTDDSIERELIDAIKEILKWELNGLDSHSGISPRAGKVDPALIYPKVKI